MWSHAWRLPILLNFLFSCDTQDSDGSQSFGGDEDFNQSSSDDEITFKVVCGMTDMGNQTRNEVENLESRVIFILEKVRIKTLPLELVNNYSGENKT